MSSCPQQSHPSARRAVEKVADVPPRRLMDGARLNISNLFYLPRQAGAPGPAYNQPDDL